MEGNPVLTDEIHNFTLEEGGDGIPDCLSFINIEQVDNCIYNSGQDFVNNINQEDYKNDNDTQTLTKIC